jgi:hypothetical protein
MCEAEVSAAARRGLKNGRAVTTAWREGVGQGSPEGVIVVDTGETAHAAQPCYFPR